MIDYDHGSWGVCFVCRCRGSVTRKALVFAIPSGGICAWMHYHYHEHVTLSETENISVSQIWAGYNWVLFFLLAFRVQQAYSRYWEGVTLLQQVRGEWFNATSSLMAFCSPDAEKANEVERFQHLLVRLVSLLYCSGLQTVSVLEDAFRVIDNSGMDEGSLRWLEGNSEKCEIILQWIQRLIIDSTRSGVIPVPAPIVSRVFQELSRGVVNLNNARKIADIPFPFPLTQTVALLLMCHFVIQPILAAVLFNSIGWAVALTIIPVWGLWGVNYIAAEIECPFGDDPNDLPLESMMDDMNTSLWTLLDKRTQLTPQFSFERKHKRFVSKLNSNRLNTRILFQEQLHNTVSDIEVSPPKRHLGPSRPKRQWSVGSNISRASRVSHRFREKNSKESCAASGGNSSQRGTVDYFSEVSSDGGKPFSHESSVLSNYIANASSQDAIRADSYTDEAPSQKVRSTACHSDQVQQLFQLREGSKEISYSSDACQKTRGSQEMIPSGSAQEAGHDRDIDELDVGGPHFPPWLSVPRTANRCRPGRDASAMSIPISRTSPKGDGRQKGIGDSSDTMKVMMDVIDEDKDRVDHAAMTDLRVQGRTNQELEHTSTTDLRVQANFSQDMEHTTTTSLRPLDYQRTASARIVGMRHAASANFQDLESHMSTGHAGSFPESKI